MSVGLNKSTLGAIVAILLALASIIWAAPHQGAAHLLERENHQASRAVEPLESEPAVERKRGSRLPVPVHFQEVEGRGLLVSAWVNGVGEYTFALDTGAGATILSKRVAQQARVLFNGNQARISGLSGAGAAQSRMSAPCSTTSAGFRKSKR